MSITKEKDESRLESSSNNNDSYAIEVKDLKKLFKGKRNMPDVKAVDGISFTVKKGEVFGLLGTNGAGKTTTIKMLTGTLKPTEGIANVGGHDVISELQDIKEMISVCPQEPAVFKFLTGLGNIKFFADLHLMPKKLVEERAEELLTILGLDESKNRFARGYSGGMVRQLSLIIALIHDPEKLLEYDLIGFGSGIYGEKITKHCLILLINYHKYPKRKHSFSQPVH